MDNTYPPPSNGYERDPKRDSQYPLPSPIQSHHQPPAHHMPHIHQLPGTPTSYHPSAPGAGPAPGPPPPAPTHSHSHSHSHAHQAPPPGSPQSSPFAFAPPPLSQGPSRNDSYYYAKPAYYGSAPMAYRSHSGESKPSPQPASRAPPPPLPPAVGSSPYSYARPSPTYSHSPHPAHPYPPQRSYSAYPVASDMPRSLSYPASYQPYPYPQPLPPLNRHNTTDAVEGSRPMGYAFANRLPLTDRPFKCDECVQSFNRNHDLKRHKRIHLSVKPFGCDKCGKTFSRKDALRRHWLVKGCRGEDGATAPITPIFPINGTPALSPPTPPVAASSSTKPDFAASSAHNDYSASMSFAHPAAPPPLAAMPSRHPSDQSTILVTPQDTGREAQVNVAPLDEPLIDPLLQPNQRESGSSDYFDGVMGVKQDGTAMMARRSPRPTFAMPFYQPSGMLAAPEMEKQPSAASDSANWHQQPRWHRPSFPFPPRNGNYYTDQGSPETPIAAPASYSG